MFKNFLRKKIDFTQLEGQTRNIFDKIFLIKKKKKRNKIHKLIKYLSLIIFAVFVFFIIFLAINFFAIKQIYNATMSGKNNLEQAIVFSQTQNFDQAEISAQYSNNNFLMAISGIEQFKNITLIRSIPYFKKQIDNIEYLLTAMEFLSRTINQSINFGQNIKSLVSEKDITFSELSFEKKRNILQQFYKSAPELNGLKANISLSLINLEQVNSAGLLFPFRGQVNKLKEQLIQAKLLLEKIESTLEILSIFAGYPEKARFLIILQNDDELRPTGGFIGTYGIVEVDSGDIVKFDTHDVYHLDMPIKDKLQVAPPEPLKKYLGIDNWYLRDANWSPDWPTSAKKINWFYQIENKLNVKSPQLPFIKGVSNEFSGVIAITPQFIIDLLTLIGPIKIDNVIYNKNNFQDLLQYEVEKGYIDLGESSWQRKEVIGEIAKELKIKLFNLPTKQLSEIFSILNNNLDEKNILIYLFDPIEQSLIQQKGWAGEIKNIKDDYLMVVDANMAALKTNAVINRNLEYEVNQNIDGLFAKLKINYAHSGHFDWKTTRYRTWTRIYAPLGSQLIKTEGFVDSEVVVTNELDKTCFGGFISIEPGKISNIYLEYKLPDNLNKVINAGNYNLYIQKQPGSNVKQLTVGLNFLNNVKSYNPVSLNFQKIDNNKMKWCGDLNIDRSYNINFE